MSFNASRAEGEFWRKLAAELKVRSRGELQKFLLLEGLRHCNRRAAQKLAALRREVEPRHLVAGALLTLFVVGMSHHDALRAPQRGHRQPTIRREQA